MDSIFITNAHDQPNLKNRINQLASRAEELKFLVGFFYFSGIHELYQGLVNNDHVILKILVGLNTDKFNNQLIEYALNEPSLTANQITDRLLQNIRLSLNDEDFDNQDFYERIGLFVKMLREDRLLIRKTRQPNHSKLYICIDLDNPFRQRTFITGSSNLTRPGLAGQAEFNVEISDYGVPQAEAYFDALWNDSIEITEHDESKTKLIKLLEKETLTREITPFEAYALALKTYIDVYNPDRALGDSVEKAFRDNNYIPYKYQLDAIKQAINIVEQNHGVIIADVVGLGKSVIASAVAKAIGKRGIVLCPPGLIGDSNNTSGWNMYLEQFGLHDWQARSVGKLEETAEFVRNTNDIEVIIVDEVHRFRNQDTQDYEHLRNICRGKKVILLTATPFNNRPNDILALLNLFVASKQSTITLDPNLAAAFRSYNYDFERLAHISRHYQSQDGDKRAKAEDYYEKIFKESPIDLIKVQRRLTQLAKEIRDVISPVTIRRNRLDLKENPDYADEVKDLSTVADPQEWFFELSEEQSTFYDQIIEHYFAPHKDGGLFTGVIYQPFNYETGEKLEKLSESENFESISQSQLADFMRRLLVKRFESSFGSFKESIGRFRKTYEKAKSFIEKTGTYILDRQLIDKIYDEDDEVIDQALVDYQNILDANDFPERYKIYHVDDFHHKKQFLRDIDADIQMFDELIQILDDMNLVSDDPKSAELIKKITQELRKPPNSGEPKRKIIVFSEYTDTVNHLRLALQPHFGERLLVVSGSLPASLIHTINQNFDASSLDQQDDYDILLSGDRISEGFNLNRAGMIINYDIPWNPVRVIQRVGRINRISRKVFDQLYIVNFFPTKKGANIVQSREIAAKKMFLIHNTLGEDVKIFDINEEPSASALYTRIQQAPDEQEGASFYTQMVKRWQQLLQDHPQIERDIKDFPPRVKVSKAGSEDELLVFFRKNRLFIQSLLAGEKEAQLLAFEEALPLIECPFEQERLPLSADFWQNYQIAREIKTDTSNRGLTQQSVEARALNNLKSLLRREPPEFANYRNFLGTLLQDMQEWATLPKYTLRSIASLKYGTQKDLNASISAIQELYLKLGPDYLEKEIERAREVNQEIVIAVENQKQ
jgi:superfamily II DNA or RNA helicase/HKD family nuclease